MAKEKYNRKSEPVTDADSCERETIDGRKVIIIGRDIRRLDGKVLCNGGIADGCQKLGPHKFTAPTTYDDFPSGLKGIKIGKQLARDSYFCRKCGSFMGCHGCAGDIATLVCNKCEDWANDLSEQVHGRMVKRDLASAGMKLVMMVSNGQIDLADFNKLWDEARAKR